MVMTLQEQVRAMQIEITSLRRLVYDNVVDRRRPLDTNKKNLTLGDIGADDKKALTEFVGGETVVAAWGLSDMFLNPEKIGDFSAAACKYYPPPVSEGHYTTEPFMLLAGPSGAIVHGDSTQQGQLTQELQAAWSLPVMTHLVKNRVPFFNAVLPAISAKCDIRAIVEYIYSALRLSTGTALIAFNSQPWVPLFEGALLMYLVGQGSPKLYFLVQTDFVHVPRNDNPLVDNLLGTPVDKMTASQRYQSINNMIESILHVYAQTMNPHDVFGRVFSNITTDQSKRHDDVSQELAMFEASMPGINMHDSIGSRLIHREGLLRTHEPSISLQTRLDWLRVLAAKRLGTDMAVYLLYVYKLSLYSSASDGLYSSELKTVYGEIVALLLSFNASSKERCPQKVELLPVAVLLNCMLPIDKQIDIKL